MKKTLAIILALIIALSLCACGSSAKYESSASSNGYISAPMAAPMEPAAAESEYYYEMKAEESGFGYDSIETSSGSQKPAVNAKLIYTADISLESTEFDNAVASLETLVAAQGGYFEQSYMNNYGNYRRANYTIRIPAEQFETFCSTVGDICHMTNISRSAEDISDAYYDTDIRLATQKTKLTRLQELLSKAEDMADIITLESAISETELQIERLTGTLRRYDSLVGYSTINVYLNEVYNLSENTTAPISFGERLASEFKSGCRSFVYGIQDFILFIAGNWAGIILWIVIIAVVVLLIKKFASRKKDKKDSSARSIFHKRKKKNAQEENQTEQE